MRLSILQELFKSVAPEGKIYGEPGRFKVVYTDGGKVYTYKNRTVYSLAERLDLIPNLPSVYSEARRVYNHLVLSGTPVEAVNGCQDEIRITLGLEGVQYDLFIDEYDRQMAVYRKPTKEELAVEISWHPEATDAAIDDMFGWLKE